jgi:hypothetical protein
MTRTPHTTGYSSYYFESDTIEVVVVTLSDVLFGYHGHVVNEPYPGYGYLSIVAHVGRSHTVSLIYLFCLFFTFGKF